VSYPSNSSVSKSTMSPIIKSTTSRPVATRLLTGQNDSDLDCKSAMTSRWLVAPSHPVGVASQMTWWANKPTKPPSCLLTLTAPPSVSASPRAASLALSRLALRHAVASLRVMVRPRAATCPLSPPPHLSAPSHRGRLSLASHHDAPSWAMALLPAQVRSVAPRRPDMLDCF
jgi:hypothetical protein